MLPTTSTRLSPKQDAESAEATDLPRNLAVRQPRKPVQVGPLELSVLSVFNHDREFVVLSRDPRTGQDTLDDVRRRSFALNEASDVAVAGIRTGTGKACEVMDKRGIRITDSLADCWSRGIANITVIGRADVMRSKFTFCSFPSEPTSLCPNYRRRSFSSTFGPCLRDPSQGPCRGGSDTSRRIRTHGRCDLCTVV